MIPFFSLAIFIFINLFILAAAIPLDASEERFFEGHIRQERESVCIECHGEMAVEGEPGVVQKWRRSWHHKNNVSCHDCHGGDPQDMDNAMSPERGFTGVPDYAEVPSFCGKCHVGIMDSYLESGHGLSLRSSGDGPNCVTCHGHHNIQKASIDIISRSLCSKCHSYERAQIMKQALFYTEKEIDDINSGLTELKDNGFLTEEEEKILFRTTAELRTLFHTTDVSLVKEKTDEIIETLRVIESDIRKNFDELEFRRNFSILLTLIFIFMGIVIFFLSKTSMRSSKDRSP